MIKFLSILNARDISSCSTVLCPPPPEIQAGFYPINSQPTTLASLLKQGNPIEFQIPKSSYPQQKTHSITHLILNWQQAILNVNTNYINLVELPHLTRRDNELNNAIYSVNDNTSIRR